MPTKYNTILAIETSCDETAVAIVKNGREILSNEIYSQINIHAQYGGVVPEVAAREHIPQIISLIKRSLDNAKLTPKDVNAIAVTYGPGLIGSLLVGVETARYLAYLWNKPLIPVNHIHGHIYANWISNDASSQADHKGRKIHFPIICLTVSGGHNELVLIKSHSERKLLGETLDDAAGEAFDKVARLLDLGYPGGPAISKAAMLATNKTDIKINKLPRAWLDKEWEKKIGKPMNFDFSFSGIKTAVRYLVEDLCGKKVTKKTLAKYQPYIALEFEQAVCEVMARKLVVAGKKWKAKEIHLAGGVSANTRLRSKITEEIAHEFPRQAPIFRFPEKISYCTDNAAMIGAAAYWIGKVMKPEKLKAVASDFRI